MQIPERRSEGGVADRAGGRTTKMNFDWCISLDLKNSMHNCYSHFIDEKTESEKNLVTILSIFFYSAILLENINFNILCKSRI